MKEQLRESFRFAPHLPAQASVKLKDYELSGQVEATHEYEAWASLRSTDRALQLGDLLETASGELRICKYVGFEPAVWFVPEPPPEKPAGSEGK